MIISGNCILELIDLWAHNTTGIFHGALKLTLQSKQLGWWVMLLNPGREKQHIEDAISTKSYIWLIKVDTMPKVSTCAYIYLLLTPSYLTNGIYIRNKHYRSYSLPHKICTQFYCITGLGAILLLHHYHESNPGRYGWDCWPATNHK